MLEERSITNRTRSLRGRKPKNVAFVGSRVAWVLELTKQDRARSAASQSFRLLDSLAHQCARSQNHRRTVGLQ